MAYKPTMDDIKKLRTMTGAGLGDVKKALVVPKDAVIERDGYHVVFMYKDGEAVWTYVDVPYANIGYYAITGCERKGTQVKAGDVVITSGNLNLADGTQVHVKKK